MIKVGVVGAGYWGKNLLRNFNELDCLYAICEVDANNPNLKPYPEAKLYQDYQAFLQDSDLTAVVIATPAETHFSLAKQALDANKHVFVEKPICLNVDDAVALKALADKHNKTLMVGHVLQYHPAFVKLMAMLQEGQIGKLQYIYSNRLNMGKIRSEENILWSFAPHDISLLLAMTQQVPEKVTTMGGDYLGNGVADVTMSTFEFPNGVKGHIFVSWLHPFKEQKMVIVGSEGMLVFNDTLPANEKLLLYPHKVDWQPGNIPVAVKENAIAIEFDVDKEPLKEECRHFIHAIESGARPRTDGEEGYRVLKVLQMCQQSLEQNGQAINQTKGPTELSYFVHDSAVVDAPATIGEGTKIWHFSHVLSGSKIGKQCNIGQNVVIGPNALIGNNVKIQNNVSVYDGVILEDDVFCGPSMVFTNVFNPRSEIPRMDELKSTRVKKGATIGANATIVCGNEIGQYAFIGAGAVVTKPVPDYALMVGNPGKQIGWMCRCGAKLPTADEVLVCGSCGQQYQLNESTLTPHNR